jgi:uncharacterized membrane protein
MATVDPVSEYLSHLQRELAGVDAAVAHDALIDAEAHLRAAIAAGKSPAAAIEDFGSAAEFAHAYVGATSAVSSPVTGGAAETRAASPIIGTKSGALAAWARLPVIGIWFQMRAWSSLFYFLAPGFAIALATFVWVIVIGSLAIGTLPIIIGAPLAVFLLGSVRAICLAEGKVVEFFLGTRMPHRVQPVQVLTPVGGVAEVGFWQRIGCWLTDVRSWLSLGYLLGNFFVATGLFAMFITLAATSFALLVAPIGQVLGLPVIQMHGDDAEVSFLFQRIEPDGSGVVHLSFLTCVVSLLAGLTLATATLWLARGTGWVYGQVVKAIQVARPQAVARRFTVMP